SGIDKASVEEIKSKLGAIEQAILKLQPSTSRIALSPPAPSSSGRVVLVNLYPEMLLFVVNQKSYRVAPGANVPVDNVPAGGLTRTPEITAASAPLAGSLIVRQRLVEWQRLLARGRSIVCEGRDQGTVVFPDAGCKFFLVADPAERAARRHRELLARGADVS